MTPPQWLAVALDAVGIPSSQHAAIAPTILAAIPRERIVAEIAAGIAPVLAQRNIRDAAGDLARELARNASQNVVAMLEGALDDEKGRAA